VVKTCHLRGGKITSCGCDQPYGPQSDGRCCAPGEAGRASLTYIDGTCVEMLAAKTVRRNNTSGVPGVEWRASKGLWRAGICFKGKRYYLGSFRKFEDAVKARKQAEEDLHDRFLQEIAARGVGRGRSNTTYNKREEAVGMKDPPWYRPVDGTTDGGGRISGNR